MNEIAMSLRQFWMNREQVGVGELGDGGHRQMFRRSS